LRALHLGPGIHVSRSGAFFTQTNLVSHLLSQEQRGLMRKDALVLAPQPHRDQVFVLASGKQNDAVDRAVGSLDLAGGKVTAEELLRTASLLRLCGAEKAFLAYGDTEEGFPWARLRGPHVLEDRWKMSLAKCRR